MKRLFWLIHKDVVSECRARQVWPTMLLLGAMVVLVFALQMSVHGMERERLACGLLWLAVYFAGTIALDRSFAFESEDGCMDGLMSYPIPTELLYVAKLIVNVLALFCLECVLIPLFIVLTGVPFHEHPARLVLVVTLANIGISAVGTLLSALVCGVQNRANLLALLVLPMTVPVLLGAAEATRLMIAGDFHADWLRWIQFLAAFAVIFVTAGVVLFDYVIEE